jgi:ribonuclease Z
MKKSKLVITGSIFGFFIGIVTFSLIAFNSVDTNDTADTFESSNRYSYYPTTETLGPDEMRVVALGTGMPTARPKQAAACFLVELGNGDKFIFDAGTGSA